MAYKKSDFSWDATQTVGDIMINPKKKIEVSFNMLEKDGEENWYVSLATRELFQRKTKGETEPSWHFTKNATFPLDIWHELSDLINNNIETE